MNEWDWELSEPGGPGGTGPPQFLGDQVTLTQTREADYTHLITTYLPDFQTFLRPWDYFTS